MLILFMYVFESICRWTQTRYMYMYVLGSSLLSQTRYKSMYVLSPSPDRLTQQIDLSSCSSLQIYVCHHVIIRSTLTMPTKLSPNAVHETCWLTSKNFFPPEFSTFSLNMHIFTNCDLLHKKSWSNFVIDIFHGQTLALVHDIAFFTFYQTFYPLTALYFLSKFWPLALFTSLIGETS